MPRKTEVPAVNTCWRSVVEAAAYLGIKAHTLDQWRSDKTNVIPYYKIGGRVFYRQEDLDEYLARCRVGA